MVVAFQPELLSMCKHTATRYLNDNSLLLIILNHGVFFLGGGLFSTTTAGHVSSQARGQIRVATAGLHHSHSTKGLELRLWHTPQLMANWIFNPLSEARDWICILMDTSQICYPWATMGTNHGLFYNFQNLFCNFQNLFCNFQNLSCNFQNLFCYFASNSLRR